MVRSNKPFAAVSLLTGTFYASDIATISSASAHGTPSPSISVEAVDFLGLQAKMTADSGGAGTLSFDLVGMLHGSSNWDTAPFATAEAVMDGTSSVVTTSVVQMDSVFKYVRINDVTNGAADHDALGVNIAYSGWN